MNVLISQPGDPLLVQLLHVGLQLVHNGLLHVIHLHLRESELRELPLELLPAVVPLLLHLCCDELSSSPGGV